MIRLKNVTKRFGDKMLLDRVDLEIRAGEFVALTGASGIGKTTLARILLGLEHDFDGEIMGLPEKRACVFQEDRLLSQLSAGDNVRFAAPDVSEARLRDAFRRLELERDIDTNVEELSGGMRRRVSMIRALLSDAELIVMDEPMKGLDAAIARQTAGYCREMLRGRTLVYITHAPEELDWMGIDRVLRLENAKITE